MQALRVIDWVVIAIYALLMVSIGFASLRYSRQSHNFFTGGRRIPWWIAGTSSWMSAFSAWVFVGVGSMCYMHGIAPMYHVLYAPAFAFFIGALLFAERWRRTGVITVPEFIEKRFNLTARQMFAWVVVPFRVFDDGVKCYATAKILSVIFHIPMTWSILGLIIITLVYTLIGGLWAVMITDTVQFIVLLVTVSIVFPAGLMRIGGLSGFFTQAPPDFFSPLVGDFSFWYLMASWAFHPFLYNSAFPLVQRFTTVRTAPEAKKVAILSGVLCVLFFPAIIGPSMVYRVIDPSLVATVGQSEEAYIRMCLLILPAGMVGIVAVTILSATMSCLSGDLNIYGGVLTYDLYHRLINKKASEKQLNWVGRTMTSIVGLVALIIAMNVEKWGGAFKVMMLIIGALAGPTAVPVLFGLRDKKASSGAAISALVVGLAAAFISKFVLKTSYPVFIFSNLIATILTYYIHRTLWPLTGEARERVHRLFGEKLEKAGSEVEEMEKEEAAQTVKVTVPPAFKIVGIIIGCVGITLGIVGLTQGFGHGLRINGLAGILFLTIGGLLVLKVKDRRD